MICQRCQKNSLGHYQEEHDVQVYKTDLDDPKEVILCESCKAHYGTLPDGDGGEVVLYYPESQDLELIELCFEEGLFGRKIAELARFLGHRSPSHLYRVSSGKGNLSNKDREAIIQHWRATHQPSPVFSPVIEDTMPGRRTLILEIEGGEKLRIPLTIVNGQWVVKGRNISWDR